MSNPYSAAYPYHDDTFYKSCTSCSKCNRVDVTKQDGHNEPEEYYCADCNALLGTVRASQTPRTTIVSNDHCG